MTFVAESYSPFFVRTLDAWERRGLQGPALRQRLSDSVQRPIDRARLEQWASQPPEGAPAMADEGERVGRDLRLARQWLMLHLIERDLRGEATLEEVCTAMTDFAEIATERAMRTAAGELVGRHGRALDAEGKPIDLLAIGMGKAGGGELNVSSDLDLVFVFRSEGETEGQRGDDGELNGRGRIAASELMHRVARRTINLLAETTGDGFVFRVDTRLRPDGDSGPLVVPYSMLEQYFFGQGREWERFAWLKGRCIADSGINVDGRAEDEAMLQQIVRPFVFRRYLDFKAFDALRDLHALIRAEVAKRDARHQGSYDVKLGRGGIREIEFTAQLFQIVRGGRDIDLRSRSTLATLARLGERGLLDADDVRRLSDAYRLLRRTEHALQYVDDAQTHRLPADPQRRATIAAMLRLTPRAFEEALAQASDTAQAVFDDLLRVPSEEDGKDADAEPSDPGRSARPGDAQAGRAAAGDGAQAVLDSDEPADDLAGDSDAADPASQPSGRPGDGEARSTLDDETVKHRLQAFRAGARYRAARTETREAIERMLSSAPVVSAEPAAVNRLIDLLDAVSGRGAYVALLAQYPQALARVLRMLGRAKWAADYLIRHPILLDEMLDGQLLLPVDYERWTQQTATMLAQAVHDGAPDVERQMDILREEHHAQVFRLLARDLEGLLTVETLSDHLSDLADRVLNLVIGLVWSQSRLKFRDEPCFAAIAYGRLGGKELGYASDLDLVFLHEDLDERAPEAYAQLAQRISGWLSTRTAAGLLFEIDLRLRPNGNAGLMVSSLASFERYERESAWVWEHQALTRARFAAGDPALGQRFEAIRRELLARPRDPQPLREQVLAMRARMLEGHPNRSGLFDLKHDRGGMVDIEFIVQFLVLAHGSTHPGLLDNAGNIALLRRAGEAGLIDAALAGQVADAYRHYRQMQHLLRLNDAQYARVDPESASAQRDAVLALWEQVFGPEEAEGSAAPVLHGPVPL